MINKQEYEKLNILEKAELHSQSENGVILIVDKETVDFPIYSWQGVYIKLCNPTKESIKENILFNDTLSDVQISSLIAFLNSKLKHGYTEFSVYQGLLAFWECCYKGKRR